jgi:curved DNA-binding protein CbpA
MQFRPEIDYYEILQVHPRASPEIVKKAYRTLMGEMRAHPDLGGDVERAKLINEAYRVLGDEDLRRAYDRARAGRTAWGERGEASPAGGGVPGVPGLDFERLAAGARKVILTVAVVITGLILARVLRNPALDLADLIAMLLVLLRIWGQVSTLGRT